MFTALYATSLCIKQARFVLKGYGTMGRIHKAYETKCDSPIPQYILSGLLYKSDFFTDPFLSPTEFLLIGIYSV